MEENVLLMFVVVEKVIFRMAHAFNAMIKTIGLMESTARNVHIAILVNQMVFVKFNAKSTNEGC
jgi:hypothetical protein